MELSSEDLFYYMFDKLYSEHFIYDKIRETKNIHYNDEYILRSCCYNNYTDMLKCLLSYSIHINSILNIHVFGEYCCGILCKNCNITGLKYIIEYGEFTNNKIDINSYDSYTMRSSITYEYDEIIKYLLYLNLHNYSYNYNTLTCYKIFSNYKESLVFNDYLLYNKNVLFTHKNTKYTIEYMCKHTNIKYIINNCIICGMCIKNINYYINYTLTI